MIGRPKLATCLISGLAALGALSFSTCNRAVERGPMDIIVITVDTLRADHLSSYGDDFIRTPNIDTIAGEGALFEQARSSAPLTLPSHTTIFTGLFPPAHGVRDNANYKASDSLTTLAEILRDKGYKTGAVVGAFVLSRTFGLGQGFDHYDDSSLRQDEKSAVFFYPERKATEVTDRALVWLKSILAGDQTKKSNFFLWAHYYDPHVRYGPPEPYSKDYGGDLYSGEIAYTDEQIGRLLNEVYRLRGKKNLLVVLTSDHGEGLGEHGEMTHGIFIYDSTIHVPLIISSPGRIKPARIPYRVRLADITPTVLDLIGIKPLPYMQGQSLVSMFEGKGNDLPAYTETAYPRIHFGWSELRGFGANGYSIIQSPKPELYADGDFRQEQDLASSKPDILQSYLKRLKVFYGELAKPELAKQAYSEMTLDAKRTLEALGYVGGAESVNSDNPDLDPFAGTNPADRKFFQLELGKVVTASIEQRYDDAVKILDKLIAGDPDNPYLYEMQGLEYQAAKNYEKAREVYLKALELNPKSATMMGRLGEVEVSLGDLKKAREYFLKAIKLYPDDALAYCSLGRLEYSMGDKAKAKSLLEKAVVISPNELRPREALGKLLMDQGDNVKAREQLEAALVNYPDDVALLSLVGKVRIMTGDRNGAIAAYAHAAELAPNSSSDQFNLALALETGRDGKFLGEGADLRGAEFYYQKAVNLDPTLPRAKERLAAVRQAMAMGGGGD